MPHLLAIDQSTSATKALLYNDRGQLLAKTFKDHRQLYPHPTWVEHDPEEIYQNTLATLRDLLQQQGGTPSGLLSLSITNQRETILIFDRNTGKPLHNALVWQDRRTTDLCATLAPKADTIRQRTGLKLDPYFSAPKLLWLTEHHPDLAQKLHDGSALIGTIDTYLLYRLTRGHSFATDHTNASRTLLFNLHSLTWDHDLCHLFKVPLKSLPNIQSSTATFGQTTLEGLLPTPIPITGILGDSQAALLAHRCLTPGSAKVTLGSGSSLLLNTGEKTGTGTVSEKNRDGDRFVSPEPPTVSALAWTHDGRPTYATEGIINYSAATLTWLKDQLRLFTSFEELEPAARAVPDTAGVYLVPAFAGLAAPHWAPAARAAILGLTPHSTRAHVLRAAQESIAYQIADALDLMRAASDVPLHSLHADGGATRNTFLMQFLADLLQLPVIVSDDPDCSPQGAALAALVGHRIVPDIPALATLPHPSTTYRPQMPPAQVASLRAGWSRAVRQVLAGVPE